MILEDKVYRSEEIKESVLIDLIMSKEVQRLKGISQFGIPDKYYHKKGFSRYEHSIGVLVLLRKLNADLKEQCAGLLHDISHTAFSHVIDWIFGDPTREDYQDNNHLHILSNSEIPNILGKYNFNYKEISNLENFSLLERKAPSLCVDRIEYSLRELWQERNFSLVDQTIRDIINVNGQLVFKNEEIAKAFTKEYVKMQNNHWAGNEARARYYIFSKILKKAIDKNVISVRDFKKTDCYIIGLLEQSKDNEILKSLDLLKNGFKIKESCKGIELKKKFRYIDSEVLIKTKIKKLSEISSDYKKILEKEKNKSDNYSKIKILTR